MHTYLYIPLFFLQSMPSFVDLLQCNLLQAMPGIRQTWNPDHRCCLAGVFLLFMHNQMCCLLTRSCMLGLYQTKPHLWPCCCLACGLVLSCSQTCCVLVYPTLESPSNCVEFAFHVCTNAVLHLKCNLRADWADSWSSSESAGNLQRSLSIVHAANRLASWPRRQSRYICMDFHLCTFACTTTPRIRADHVTLSS